MENFKVWFDDYVAGFYGNDDFVNEHLKLKEEHSRRVCQEMQFLANELELSENRQRIAEAIALFHDIGRFKQFVKYRTYSDILSTNHCTMGLEVLAETNVLDKVEKQEKDIIEKAIECHGMKDLPSDMNGECLLFTKLIRDADKLDVFYVAIEYYSHYKKTQEKYLLGLEVPDKPGYTPEMVDAVLQKKQIDYHQVRTLDDMKLLQLAWVYDVNFIATLKRIKQRGFIEILAGFLPQTADMQRVKEEILSYIDFRIEKDDM